MKTESLKKPFIIPVFLPQAGCPHQCIFCNQKKITGETSSELSPEKLQKLIRTYLNYKKANRSDTQIAFYGGNFLGLRPDNIRILLEAVSCFIQSGEINSIRFSTRPDTITDETIDLIKDYPVETVELGVQSMDDDILKMAGRGHTVQNTMCAVALLKKSNVAIGLQMMIGLPGDDEAGVLETVRAISKLQPDFVRIYPLLVIKDSPLEKMYKQGKYIPLPLKQCVSLVKFAYLIFKDNNIPVIRMGLQVSDDLEEGAIVVAGPYHPAFGHLVHSEIFLDMAISAITSQGPAEKDITIHVHPRSISKMQGISNANIIELKKKFKLYSVNLIQNDRLEEDRIELTCR
ncbi:MAG: radical SAM protein [Desulfobacterales bacterium]|nr:radical SAM protein [Desulfobacterales bacterium]